MVKHELPYLKKGLRAIQGRHSYGINRLIEATAVAKQAKTQ